MWVEVNSRVNYPIKSTLLSMVESGDLSLDSELTQYCVSWFGVHVAGVGISLFVHSWNEHPIPGRPTQLYACMHAHIIIIN